MGHMAFFEVEKHEGVWQCFQVDLVRGRPLFSIPVPKIYPEDPGSTLASPAVALPEPQWGRTPWVHTTENGVTFQIVGICLDNGHTWWLPDGTPPAFWPGHLSRKLGAGTPFESVNDDLIEMAYSHHYDIPRGERLLVMWTSASRLQNSNHDMHNTFGQWQSDGPMDCLDPLTDQEGHRVNPGRYIVLRLHPDHPGITIDRIVRLYCLSKPNGALGRPSPKRVHPIAEENGVSLVIHLKNISLNIGQRTDFSMEVTEGDGDGSPSPRIVVSP